MLIITISDKAFGRNRGIDTSRLHRQIRAGRLYLAVFDSFNLSLSFHVGNNIRHLSCKSFVLTKKLNLFLLMAGKGSAGFIFDKLYLNL